MLRISENKRFIIQNNNTPFFYLGDTAWCMFHRLKREEVDIYLKKRAEQGFTVIQAVVLSEGGGLELPNAYGEKEFINNDILKPNDAYFRHIDYCLETAAKLGLYIGLLPSWGDKVGYGYWGSGPSHFINEGNAFEYGRFLGARYGNMNIIWILGGDRPADGNEETWRRMAYGIKAGEVAGKNNLMTYHPMGGGFSSSLWFHSDDWLDFNMIQSTHSSFVDNWKYITYDYTRTPVKPCMDGETSYEEIPNDFDTAKGYVNDWAVRTAAYRAVFAGAHGHTYGCNAIWQFASPESRYPLRIYPYRSWRESLDLPGAKQMKYLKNLMLSRPYLSRIPDQSLIVDGQSFQKLTHIRVTRDGSTGNSDATYAFVYFTFVREIVLDLSVFRGNRVQGWWYDPRNGTVQDAGIYEKTSRLTVTYPGSSKFGGRDRILVLDDTDAGYKAPGTV